MKIILVLGIILFEFAIANMLIGYPSNEQIIEPFPMTILDLHFPFHYTFVKPAMYFEGNELIFNEYWMIWSLFMYVGMIFIGIWAVRYYKQNSLTQQNFH
jgi:hypothetical protein